MNDYRAPQWLLGGHLQTIWPALFSRRFLGPAPQYRRERWTTPDGDFIDVDFQPGPAGSPLLVLFHGLEGSSRSHYSEAFAHWARDNAWSFAVPHFRGCSGEINLAPRAYHSGDFEEVGWMLQRLRERHGAPVFAVGVSLGGNALLRWAEEAGGTAVQTARAVAAVCSPVDLDAGERAIAAGFNRLVYTRMFLATMKPKALAKLQQHPGLFDARRLQAARSLREFDDVFTGPVHGFQDAADYYTRGSAKPRLREIRIPALVVNALNDPFIPAACLPKAGEVAPCVTLWRPAHGGHVGFPQGLPPGHVLTLPGAVMNWIRSSA
jgi:predicted alpha/beta-fold hydrolase